MILTVFTSYEQLNDFNVSWNQSNKQLHFYIQVERDLKIGKIKENDANYQKLEILGALQKLEETLTSSETTFLTEQTIKSGKKFFKNFSTNNLHEF